MFSTLRQMPQQLDARQIAALQQRRDMLGRQMAMNAPTDIGSGLAALGNGIEAFALKRQLDSQFPAAPSAPNFPPVPAAPAFGFPQQPAPPPGQMMAGSLFKAGSSMIGSNPVPTPPAGGSVLSNIVGSLFPSFNRPRGGGLY